MTFWQGVVFGSGLAIGGMIVALGILAVCAFVVWAVEGIDYKRWKARMEEKTRGY